MCCACGMAVGVGSLLFPRRAQSSLTWTLENLILRRREQETILGRGGPLLPCWSQPQVQTTVFVLKSPRVTCLDWIAPGVTSDAMFHLQQAPGRQGVSPAKPTLISRGPTAEEIEENWDVETWTQRPSPVLPAQSQGCPGRGGV